MTRAPNSSSGSVGPWMPRTRAPAEKPLSKRTAGRMNFCGRIGRKNRSSQPTGTLELRSAVARCRKEGAEPTNSFVNTARASKPFSAAALDYIELYRRDGSAVSADHRLSCATLARACETNTSSLSALCFLRSRTLPACSRGRRNGLSYSPSRILLGSSTATSAPGFGYSCFLRRSQAGSTIAGSICRRAPGV